MKIKLAYGKEGLNITVPRKNILKIVERKSKKGIKYPEEAIKFALRNPIKSLPLKKLARGKRSSCVIFSDKTRPVPNRIILPPILEILEESGINRNKIIILVATGLHSHCGRKDLFEMLGKNIVKNYNVIHHNARTKKCLKFLGYTGNKTPVFVNKHYLGAELKIVTGLIEPHFMAGYSGGRKAICPGISGIETIKHQHGPRYLESHYAIPGNLDKNPFNEEMMEIARMAGIDFLVNVTLNEKREIDGVFAGDIKEAFLQGVNHAEKNVKIEVPCRAEIVITAGAGYPLDTTFYQAVKGMVAALSVVKKNGLVIIASKCEEGIGSKEFENLLHSCSNYKDFLKKIRKPGFFVIDQWEVEEMCKVLKKAEIMFYSSQIRNDVLKELMVTPINSVEDGIKEGLHRYGSHAKIIVIPKGPYVIPYCKSPISPFSKGGVRGII